MVVPKIYGMGSWNVGREEKSPFKEVSEEQSWGSTGSEINPEHERGSGSGSLRQNHSTDPSRDKAGCFPQLHRGCLVFQIRCLGLDWDGAHCPSTQLLSAPGEC